MVTFNQIAFLFSLLALASFFYLKWLETIDRIKNPFRFIRVLDKLVCYFSLKFRDIHLPDFGHFFVILSIVLKHFGYLLSVTVFIFKHMFKDIKRVVKRRHVKNQSEVSSLFLRTMIEAKNKRKE
jgi:hypothetical protein